MSGQESWLFSDKKYRNGISLVTICELQEESNVSAVLLAQENTISQDERKCGSIQCPDTGNEGLIDKCHLGNASESWSCQAALQEFISGLVTPTFPKHTKHVVSLDR